MNKERRKVLSEVLSKLDEARDLLDTVLTEEQEAFDNMPEGLQMSERGEQMEEGIGTMEDALSRLEDVHDNLEEML